MHKQVVTSAAKLLKRRDLVLAGLVFLFKVAEAVSATVPRKRDKGTPEAIPDNVTH